MIRDNARVIETGPIVVPRAVLNLLRQETSRDLFAVYMLMKYYANQSVVPSAIAQWSDLLELRKARTVICIRLLRKLGLIQQVSTGARKGERVFKIVEPLTQATVRTLQGIGTRKLKPEFAFARITNVETGEVIDLGSSRFPQRHTPVPTETYSKVDTVPTETYSKVDTVPTETHSTKVRDGLDDAVSQSNETTSLDAKKASETDSTDSGISRPIDSCSKENNGNTTNYIAGKSAAPDAATGQPETPPVEPKKGRPKKTFKPEERPDVWEVWQYHAEQLFPFRKDTLPPNDWAGRIQNRLDEGATVEQMKLIVDWAKQDPWMNGTDPNNKSKRRYFDIKNLFNSPGKFTAYIAVAQAWREKPKVDGRGMDMALSWSPDKDPSKPKIAFKF